VGFVIAMESAAVPWPMKTVQARVLVLWNDFRDRACLVGISWVGSLVADRWRREGQIL
jgi:hypothetical protein